MPTALLVAQDGVFKIGLVAPTTGPLAGFGEVQDGKPVPEQIITKDSRSNPNRAAKVAQDPILNTGINLMLPGPLAAAGCALTDPGRYQPMNNDFSAQIAAFKAAGCEIVTGVMIPPDFATFWAQAAQQGFKPKVATIGCSPPWSKRRATGATA